MLWRLGAGATDRNPAHGRYVHCGGLPRHCAGSVLEAALDPSSRVPCGVRLAQGARFHQGAWRPSSGLMPTFARYAMSVPYLWGLCIAGSGLVAACPGAGLMSAACTGKSERGGSPPPGGGAHRGGPIVRDSVRGPGRGSTPAEGKQKRRQPQKQGCPLCCFYGSHSAQRAGAELVHRHRKHWCVQAQERSMCPSAQMLQHVSATYVQDVLKSMGGSVIHLQASCQWLLRSLGTTNRTASHRVDSNGH